MQYQYQGQTVSLDELRLIFRNVSFPSEPSESDLAPLGVTLIPDPVPTPEELLAQAKADKLAEINAVCQSTLEALTPTYPERELTTFDKQESEARACLADPAASTPLLSALAAGRGIELADLVQRVIAKADAFTIASGFIIGQRQALEDRLDAAQTVDDVQAVIVTITMPGAV